MQPSSLSPTRLARTFYRIAYPIAHTQSHTPNRTPERSHATAHPIAHNPTRSAPPLQLFGPLRAAYDLYSPNGLLHDPENPPGPDALNERAFARTPPPLALDDWLARVYLARLSAKLVFSGTAQVRCSTPCLMCLACCCPYSTCSWSIVSCSYQPCLLSPCSSCSLAFSTEAAQMQPFAAGTYTWGLGLLYLVAACMRSPPRHSATGMLHFLATQRTAGMRS